MPSLLEALEAREAEVRGWLEELAGQVAGAQAELDRPRRSTRPLPRRSRAPTQPGRPAPGP